MSPLEKRISVSCSIPDRLRAAVQKYAKDCCMSVSALIAEDILRYAPYAQKGADLSAVKSEMTWARNARGKWPCRRMSVKIEGASALVVCTLADRLMVSRGEIIRTRLFNKYWPEELAQ